MLKPGQRIIKCPSCRGDSIVYPATITRPKSPKYRKCLRSQTYQSIRIEKPMLATTTKHWKSTNDAVINHTEYAECTKCKSCFCTNCLGPLHQGSVCPIKPLGSSPNSDDEIAPIRRSAHNAKSSLKRLKF